MTVTVDFDIKGIKRKINKGIKQGVEALHVQLNADIKKRLSLPGTGKKYPPMKTGPRKGYPKKRSAAKGQPPAVQTGRLRNSWTINANVKTFQGGYRSVVRQKGLSSVVSPVKYGYWLETDKAGTIGKGDHPYLGGPKGAFTLMKPKAQSIFDAYLRKAIRDAGGKA